MMTEPRLELRAMRFSDIADVMEIELRSYTMPWTEPTFRSLLRRPDAELLVAAVDGVLVGYAVSWYVLDQGELGNVAVAPNWRNRGVGRRLVCEVLGHAHQRGVREVFLEVRPSNQVARQLYERLGFQEVGRRRNYYMNPREDAVVMRAPAGWETKQRYAEG